MEGVPPSACWRGGRSAAYLMALCDFTGGSAGSGSQEGLLDALQHIAAGAAVQHPT